MSLGTPPTFLRSTTVAQNLPVPERLPTLVVQSERKTRPLSWKGCVNFFVAPPVLVHLLELVGGVLFVALATG